MSAIASAVANLETEAADFIQRDDALAVRPLPLEGAADLVLRRPGRRPDRSPRRRAALAVQKNEIYCAKTGRAEPCALAHFPAATTRTHALRASALPRTLPGSARRPLARS